MKTIFASLLILFVLSAKAQEFSYSAQVGLVLSNTHVTNKPQGLFPDFDLYDPMLSWHANFVIRLQSKENWGVTIEPGFIQKGGRLNSSFSGGASDLRLTMNYLQIPVLLEWYVTEKFIAVIGPELAIQLSARLRSGSNFNDVREIYNKDFEISGLIGMGYRITEQVELGVRYNHGLLPISDVTFTNASGDESGAANEFHQYANFFVRYNFGK